MIKCNHLAYCKRYMLCLIVTRFIQKVNKAISRKSFFFWINVAAEFNLCYRSAQNAFWMAISLLALSSWIIRQEYQSWKCFCTSLQDQKFDIGHVTKYFESKRTSGDLAIYYELDKCEDISTRGIIDICPFSNRVTKFYEKPSLGETTSRNASVVFYFLRYETRLLIKE